MLAAIVQDERLELVLWDGIRLLGICDDLLEEGLRPILVFGLDKRGSHLADLIKVDNTIVRDAGYVFKLIDTL